MSILKRVGHEVAAVWLASAYFASCFLTIMLFKKLMLVQYEIEFQGASVALLGALLVGKVVVVLDGTSFGDRFHRHAVAVDVLYRSLIYTSVVAVVVGAEKLWHQHHEHIDWMGAALAVVDAISGSRMMATSLCVFLSFVGWNLLSEMSRYLGRERLVRFLFSPAETMPGEEPSARR